MSTVVKTSMTRIVKAEGDKQIVYGEVYAPNRLDTQGEMMLAEDIELMAHRFLMLPQGTQIDVKHNNVAIKAYVVESFIAREGDPDYTPGAWVLGVKIEDADVWADIRSGKLNGFSFQAMTKHVEATVEVEYVRDHVGKTEENDGHDHYFFVTIDETGRVTGGRTSKAADGHFHVIKTGSKTEQSNDHGHRYFL